MHAVRGNVDTGAWAEQLPPTRVVEIGNLRLFVLHRIADLNFDPAAQGFRAVVFGHSHTASQELRNGILYLNPGSAGPGRFRLPVTLARMLVDGDSVHPDIINIDR